MNKIYLAFLLIIFLYSTSAQFCTTQGKRILDVNGNQLFLKGISFGNWLNAEGYMLGFDKTSSYRLINTAFSELLNEQGARQFWTKFRSAYITDDDFKYIKKVGFNVLRLPFNYKLFINQNSPDVIKKQGFDILNYAIQQCKLNNIYLVLDMHSLPGGQTGANIDDSYGYPFLYQNQYYINMTINLWRTIANQYKNQSIILGYQLMNEPISTSFNTGYFIPKLQPIYKRITAAIREVDRNHIIILDGAVWASQFWSAFGAPFDSKLIYTYHKYWVDPTQQNIQQYLDFGNNYNVPVWMGESGENTNSWIQTFRILLERNGVHWAFWPYKKLNSDSCVRQFKTPTDWSQIVSYIEGDRSTIDIVAQRRPSFNIINAAFADLLVKLQFSNTVINSDYIRALGLNP